MNRFDASSNTRRRKARLAALCLLIAFFFAGLPIVVTRAGDPLEQKLIDLQKKKNKTKKLLTQKKLERGSISVQINKYDIELSKVERSIGQTQRDLTRKREEFNFLSRRLVDTTEKYDHTLNRYRDRLVAYYKNGTVSYLEVLMNSTSFSDFISRMHYLRLIAKNDQETMGYLQDMCREIEGQRVQVESAQMRIQALNDSLSREKRIAQGMKREKMTALAQVRRDEKLLRKELEEFEAESRRIEDEIRSKQQEIEGIPDSFAGGAFGNPLCGREMIVTSNFGHRKRPGRGASTNHQGVDLGAKNGTSICAAADGVVLASRRRSGYGLTVILAHSKDVSTLYAHGQRLIVSEGQKVNRGDVVMTADNTGTSYGSHLHFEIRLNGKPVNPLNYFSGRYRRK